MCCCTASRALNGLPRSRHGARNREEEPKPALIALIVAHHEDAKPGKRASKNTAPKKKAPAKRKSQKKMNPMNPMNLIVTQT